MIENETANLVFFKHKTAPPLLQDGTLKDVLLQLHNTWYMTACALNQI